MHDDQMDIYNKIAKLLLKLQKNKEKQEAYFEYLFNYLQLKTPKKISCKKCNGHGSAPYTSLDLYPGVSAEDFTCDACKGKEIKYL